jgi:hypothetical protein
MIFALSLITTLLYQQNAYVVVQIISIETMMVSALKCPCGTRREAGRPSAGTKYTKVWFNSQKFLPPPITVNVWTHAWSTKHR